MILEPETMARLMVIAPLCDVVIFTLGFLWFRNRRRPK